MPTFRRLDAVDVSRPLDPAKKNQAVDLYLAGKPVEEITTTTGISGTLLYRELTRRGIPPRMRYVLPDADIIAAYRQGATEYGLSRQYGVSRGVISRVLREHGVQRHTQSESMTAAAALKTPEQRKARAAAAHATSRRLNDIDKFRRALRNEIVGDSQSDGERQFADMLRKRGIQFMPQRAIGWCNVDFAVAPVAVEILGGGWHSRKTTHAMRTPYILDWGWHLVMIWDYEGRSALGAGAADYLVSFLEEIRRNPPATCQYRVIAGQGELLTACGRESNQFPLEPPPRGALNLGA